MKFPISPSPTRWLHLGWLCLALLAACGQKGPLYLPEPPPPAPTTKAEAVTEASPEAATEADAKVDSKVEPAGDDDEPR
jgi:predicted small lipoprotein YifL